MELEVATEVKVGVEVEKAQQRRQGSPASPERMSPTSSKSLDAASSRSRRTTSRPND